VPLELQFVYPLTISSHHEHYNYSPKLDDGNSEFDAEAVEEFYKGIFADLSVDMEENESLLSFFQENIPPSGSLVSLRATAFKAAVEFLNDDQENNISLLRCINVAVHGFETTCLV
jgi:hypothetical protein